MPLKPGHIYIVCALLKIELNFDQRISLDDASVLNLIRLAPESKDIEIGLYHISSTFPGVIVVLLFTFT